MATELTLEAVKVEFDKWRATKNPGEQVPQRLWSLAKQLTKRYKRSEIAYQLRIAASQYKKHLYGDIKEKQHRLAPKTNDFVKLVPANAMTNHQNQSSLLTIEVNQANGNVIVLHAHNQEAMATILNHIMN